MTIHTFNHHLNSLKFLVEGMDESSDGISQKGFSIMQKQMKTRIYMGNGSTIGHVKVSLSRNHSTEMFPNSDGSKKRKYWNNQNWCKRISKMQVPPLKRWSWPMDYYLPYKLNKLGCLHAQSKLKLWLKGGSGYAKECTDYMNPGEETVVTHRNLTLEPTDLFKIKGLHTHIH